MLEGHGGNWTLAAKGSGPRDFVARLMASLSFASAGSPLHQRSLRRKAYGNNFNSESHMRDFLYYCITEQFNPLIVVVLVCQSGCELVGCIALFEQDWHPVNVQVVPFG